MKLKKIFQLALLISHKKSACLEEIEKRVTPLLLPTVNIDQIYAKCILETTSNIENEQVKHVYDILKICAEAQMNPPVNFEPLNKLQSLKNIELFKHYETDIQEKYAEFYDEAFHFVKERKTSTATNKSNPKNTEPAKGGFVSDLKAALSKRPKTTVVTLDKKNVSEKNNEKEKPPEILTPASINERAKLIVASLKKDTPKNPTTTSLKVTSDAKAIPNNKEFNLEKQKNETLQKEMKQLKQKLETAQKNLDDQHKVILMFQADAKENSKKIHEMENEIIDIYSLYYLIDPFIESAITTKEIAELVHYIAQDFRLSFLHKSALASLAPDDKLRDSFNKLYDEYHKVNQDILMGDNQENYAKEDKKAFDSSNKEVCIALQRTFHVQDDKSKPGEKEWRITFLSEILKRIKNLEPNSPISKLAAKCGSAFIHRNIKKLLEDAKNIQKYLNSPTNKNSAGFFNSTTQPNNSTATGYTSPYITAITNLLASAYSKAFG